jgi:hypothetical protein
MFADTGAVGCRRKAIEGTAYSPALAGGESSLIAVATAVIKKSAVFRAFFMGNQNRFIVMFSEIGQGGLVYFAHPAFGRYYCCQAKRGQDLSNPRAIIKDTHV